MKIRKASSKPSAPSTAEETDLRERAKAIVSEKGAPPTENTEDLSPEAMRQALHELRVHQIELEIQNEELRKRQAALEATNERYFSFYDLAPVGFCTLTDKGQILETNLTFADWIGIDRTALVNTPLSLFILPEDQDLYFLHKKQLFKTNEAQTFELRMLSQDGMPFWVSLAASAFHFPEGAPVCQIVISDITGHKQTENALRESEKNLASMFNAIAESVYLIDTEGILLSVNETAAQRFGLKPENMQGKLTYNFLPENIAKSRRKTIEEVFRTGREARFEDCRSGSHFKHTLYPIFGEDGNVIRIAGFSQNITSLKTAEEALYESEEKARAILNSTNDAVALFSREGILLDLNDAYAMLLNKKKEDVKGECIWEYFPPEVVRYRMPILEQVFSTGKPVKTTDERNNRIYEANLYPISNVDGLTTRAALFVHDVTEKQQAEKELIASHAQLRELSQHLQEVREQERIRIARGIHDELGQVLTAITLETSWLAKKLTRRQKALKASAETTANLATDAIRSVKRIISELRPALLSDLGLGEAIKWQAAEYQKRSGLTFAISIGLGDKIFPDDMSTAIFRIFQEAITNVIRHAGATGVTVSMKETDGCIELIVKDNGAGFDESMRREDSFGITGMKERAHVLGGKLEISGIPKKGSTVVARIPIKINKQTAKAG